MTSAYEPGALRSAGSWDPRLALDRDWDVGFTATLSFRTAGYFFWYLAFVGAFVPRATPSSHCCPPPLHGAARLLLAVVAVVRLPWLPSCGYLNWGRSHGRGSLAPVAAALRPLESPTARWAPRMAEGDRDPGVRTH